MYFAPRTLLLALALTTPALAQFSILHHFEGEVGAPLSTGVHGGKMYGFTQFGLTFEEPNLMITLWGAEGLRMVESHNDVSLPKPYCIVRLCMFG